MTMNRTEQFLDTYKRLEQAATSAFGWEADGRAVSRLERMAQFSDIRAELHYCREVRNLLQHHYRIGGEYAVEPSQAMVALLDTLLRRLTHPKTCLDIGTPMREVFHCAPGDPVAPAMAVMIRRGLSHVPILQNRIVQGVFSESTVFAYLVQKKLSGLPEGLRFSDLSEYLHAPTRRSEIYRFLSPEAPSTQAEAAFEAAFRQGKRISMFLLTRSGQPDAPLLGILTPYDLLAN